MRVTILNGNPEPADRGFDDYVAALGAALRARGHEPAPYLLRDLELRHCLGCFDCWWQSPGECKTADDGRTVARAVIGADLALLCSPVIMGHVSALLRAANERLLPLLHPYIDIVGGELHHHQRYPRRPRLALLLARRPDTDDEDLAIVRESYRRTAANFATSLGFVRQTSDPIEEVCDAIDRH